MLSIDLAINGRTIGHVAVRNLGAFDESRNTGLDCYEYRVELDRTWRPTQRTVGRLVHRVDDGAFALVRKVFDEISAST